MPWMASEMLGFPGACVQPRRWLALPCGSISATVELDLLEARMAALVQGVDQHPPTRYSDAMAKTTIQVDTATRDQLATLAAEQGTTMGALLASWAIAHPTQEQRAMRVRSGREAMRAHTPHALTDEQLDAMPNVLERLRALVGDAAA